MCQLRRVCTFVLFFIHIELLLRLLHMFITFVVLGATLLSNAFPTYPTPIRCLSDAYPTIVICFFFAFCFCFF